MKLATIVLQGYSVASEMYEELERIDVPFVTEEQLKQLQNRYLEKAEKEYMWVDDFITDVIEIREV